MKTSVPFPSKTLMKPLWGIMEKFRDLIEFRFKPLSLQTDRKWKPRKGEHSKLEPSMLKKEVMKVGWRSNNVKKIVQISLFWFSKTFPKCSNPIWGLDFSKSPVDSIVT